LGIDKMKAKVVADVKAGWGDWAVPGAPMGVSNKTLQKRDRQLGKLEADAEAKKAQRKDNKMSSVMFSERRIKGGAKYKLTEVPHPFTSMEEYERSIQMPLGGMVLRFACKK
jgi:U3 small nucleolar RNA-associated protein 14